MNNPEDVHNILEAILADGNQTFWEAVYTAHPDGLYFQTVFYQYSLPDTDGRSFFFARTGRRIGNHTERLKFRCSSGLLAAFLTTTEPKLNEGGTPALDSENNPVMVEVHRPLSPNDYLEIVGSVYADENTWGIDVVYLRRTTPDEPTPYKGWREFQTKIHTLFFLGGNN